MMGGSVTRSTTPLLDFTWKPIGGRRNWKNVVQQRFEGKLTQQRDVTENDDVGNEIVRALRRTIENQIKSDPSIIDNSHIHFTMQSDSFSYAFQSTSFTFKEFNDDSERLDMYLQTLAAKLNSNEEFTPDETFTMETTFIHSPGMGRGNGKRYKASSAVVRGISKRSRVTFKNDDELCCARAIVTNKLELMVEVPLMLITKT